MNPQLPSESKISEILAHEELAHEDKDPIYPFEPVQGEKPKHPESTGKNTHNKKERKRKTSN